MGGSKYYRFCFLLSKFFDISCVFAKGSSDFLLTPSIASVVTIYEVYLLFRLDFFCDEEPDSYAVYGRLVPGLDI